MLTFHNEADMIAFGEKLGKALESHSVITLTGELGAGKTTLTKGIGRGLGIKKIINSPTFTIVKIYEGDKTLYHFDAYRLEDSDDDLGFEEMIDDEIAELKTKLNPFSRHFPAMESALFFVRYYVCNAADCMMS